MLPQMREYDRARINWTPYVMFTNLANNRSPVYNTDGYGFRSTWYADRSISYHEFQEHDGSKGIVCGGSVAFGIGASSDAMTIPSLLNVNTDTLWFNFGGRAFNSTQELLMFLFFRPDIDKVILFSGVNTLLTHFLSNKFSYPFGSFFHENNFHALQSPSNVRQLIRQIIPGRIIRRFLRSLPPSDCTTLSEPFESKMKSSLQIVERDLEVWKILKESMKFSLTYVLQPFAPCTGKQFSPEETELFEILDHRLGPDWQNVYGEVASSYGEYANRLQDMCAQKDIPFANGNDILPNEGWMFCDRVHLTDQGNMVFAEAMRSAFGLGDGKGGI